MKRSIFLIILAIILICNLINNYQSIKDDFFTSHPLDYQLSSKYLYENFSLESIQELYHHSKWHMYLPTYFVPLFIYPFFGTESTIAHLSMFIVYIAFLYISYRITEHYFNPWNAQLTILLLAITKPVLESSRILYEDLPFATLLLLIYWLFLKRDTKRIVQYIVFGLSFITYYLSKLSALFITPYMILLFLIFSRKKNFVRNLIYMGIGFFIITTLNFYPENQIESIVHLNSELESTTPLTTVWSIIQDIASDSIHTITRLCEYSIFCPVLLLPFVTFLFPNHSIGFAKKMKILSFFSFFIVYIVLNVHLKLFCEHLDRYYLFLYPLIYASLINFLRVVLKQKKGSIIVFMVLCIIFFNNSTPGDPATVKTFSEVKNQRTVFDININKLFDAQAIHFLLTKTEGQDDLKSLWVGISHRYGIQNQRVSRSRLEEGFSPEHIEKGSLLVIRKKDYENENSLKKFEIVETLNHTEYYNDNIVKQESIMILRK